MKNTRLVAVCAAALVFAACTNEAPKKEQLPAEPELTHAEQVVQQAIETAGGTRYTSSSIAFDFRDLYYQITRDGGAYQMERTRIDSNDTIHDVLTNDAFYREQSGEEIHVPDSMVVKYSNSINSVFYFALLPYGLNDAAANKTSLGSTSIKDQEYHKIKVTFDQEGGGEDFDDVFIYWINTASNTIDFLAYEYHTHGGGIRFREAYNSRTVGGIRFADYVNYKPKEKGSVNLELIDEAFLNGQLKELSRIELENVLVNQID